MPNAKDLTGSSSSILLVGDSGTGKTKFLETIVRAGQSVYAFDFDGGMASVRGADIEYDTFKEADKGQPVPKTASGLYPYGTAWLAFIKKLNDLGTLMDAGKGPQNIALDSLTFMSMIAMNKILKDTNQDQPHQGSWGAQQEYLKRVLNQVSTWPVRLICTAHIQRDKNDITTATEKLPLLTGKLAGFIGAFFDEVYFTDYDTDKDGKRKFVLITAGDKEYRQAKSRYGVPNKTPTDFAEVAKFYPKVKP